MKKVLIIGQGIAGTVLAWTLHRRGVSVQLADVPLPGAASPAAAGMINPITGKRFVKGWRMDELLPFARDFYQDLEKMLGVSIWQELTVLRLLPTPEDQNNWALRCQMPDYQDYIAELPEAGLWQSFLKTAFRAGLIRQAARVEFGVLLPAFRRWAAATGIFQEKEMTYEEVTQQADAYDHIIFCEGWRGQHNPFFPDLPWRVAKGEALLLRFSDAAGAVGLTSALKGGAMLIPIGQNLFWAGATNQWHFDDAQPTRPEGDLLLKHLREMLDVPFEVIDHVAGIRPTVKDRRPFIGLSPENPRYGMFNGLGTKGALLAPFWAAHFADHLLEGSTIDREVSIERGIRKY